MPSFSGSLLLVFVLVVAPGTSTAILSIDAPATYTPGEVLTITLAGDSEGRTSDELGAVLRFDPDLTIVGRAPGALDSSAPVEWTRLDADMMCGDSVPDLAANECVAAEAFTLDLPPALIDLLPSTLSTWQFDTSGARGDLVFALDPGVPMRVSGFFDFPGTQITVAMIPEPSTALLLGLGLTILSMRRERRV